MASQREYNMLFALNAQLGSSYNSTFSKAQQQVISMQKEIDALSKTQSDIAAYQKQQGAIDTTGKKLAVLQQQYDNIQKEMSETEGYSSALENKLLSKQQQIDKTGASLAGQTAKLGQMGAALRAAGVDTDSLEKETGELGVKIDDVKKKQEEAADKAGNFSSAASQAFNAVHEAIVAAGIAVALKEIFEYFKACADASMAFESAMTGVAKTTDFTDEEFAAMSAAMKEMSTDIPATTTELAAIAEAAGQLGIAKGSLLGFTEIMAMLGTATNMTSDEAATMLAQFTSVTGMDPGFYDELGSTIVALGNKYATTERNISEMSQTIAAAGSIAGMSEADIAAIAAAVTSLGISTKNGATQMNKLISDINSAVSSGENLEDWASVARMSADEFSAAWGNNAAGALDLFIRGLNGAYESGQDVYSILADLGITETRMVTMMTSLAKSGDRLTNTLSTANEAWAANTALTTEAEKRYATTQSQLTLMQNAYNNLQVAIGDAYTPALKEAYSVGTDMFDGMAKFVAQNPGLVRAITAAAVVLGTVTAALAAYTIAAKLAAIASAALSAAIPGLNVIMAVTAGVALLAAGIAALAGATDEEAEEVRGLTEASREQYFQIQDLTAEYENAVAVYGETSDEARELRWQIEDLTAEYEYSKQTVEQFVQEIRDSVQANDELVQKYRDTTDALDKQEYNVTTLINRLESLVSQNDQTAASQEQIKATVDALNKALPELNLNYEDVIANGDDFIETIKTMAQAEASQQRYQENYAAYVDLLIKATGLEQDVANTLAQKEAAQTRYNTANDEYMETLTNMTRYDTSGMAGVSAMFTEEYKEAVAAEEALTSYTEAHDLATASLEANITEQREALAVMKEYAGVEGEATEGNQALQEALSETILKVEDLAAAYNDAYDAALESVQGQYQLWEEAAQVVATSAETINAGIESQLQYWQDYNANLSDLGERSADIEGLGEMISSFADGSSESVNAIAGMATATDEELAAMISNWQALQEEQKTVADSLAELETEFSEKMAALQKELEDTIAEMDLGSEAAEAGKSTVQGFINSANAMLPQVETAYSRVAQAAIDAINEKLDINSPSRVMFESGEYAMAGFTGGVTAMEPEVAAAMREAATMGLDAFSAEQAQFVTFAPQLLAALSAVSAQSSVLSAEGGGYGGLHIQISPQYNIRGMEDTEQLGTVLTANTENIRGLIIEVIEDYELDAARRRY